jgi:sugar phosphate isomerase/epimerase
MKIGVSSYSFSRLVAAGRCSQLDVVTMAKDMGFDAIEFAGFQLPEGEPPISFAPKARAACEAVGLPIVNYAIGADFLNPPQGSLEDEIERVKEEVRVAHALGSPLIRHDATRGFDNAAPGPKDFDTALPTLLKGCRAVTEFAASLGVRTSIENHGYFCQDSARVEKLVCAVNHPNFGWLVDMGNFTCADEDPAIAVARAMPYAFHVHAKDFHMKSGNGHHPGEGWFSTRGGNLIRGAIIGHGDVPILQCLRNMKAVGYRGVLSIEFEGMEEAEKGIALGLDNLRRFVAQVYG